jgi:hypothetical protein
MNDYNVIIDGVQWQMISGGLASLDSIIGCTEDEIDALEKQYDIQYPTMYRTFLARMGHAAGDFLVGTDWTYPVLNRLRSHGESLIAEAGTAYRLPKEAFVFAMHQGYSFLFLHTMFPDPPVWLYVEGDKKPKEVASSFSGWLRETVSEESQLKAELGL